MAASPLDNNGDSGMFSIIVDDSGNDVTEPERRHTPISCSICRITTAMITSPRPGLGSHRNSNDDPTLWQRARQRCDLTLPRMHHPPGLETSFVNVPSSLPQPVSPKAVQAAVDYIFTHELYAEANDEVPAERSRTSSWREFYGSDMIQSTQRTEAAFKATTDLIRASSDDADNNAVDNFYCLSCLDRIATSLEKHSQLLLNESVAYEEAATREEMRMVSIRRALSSHVPTNSNTISDNERDPVLWTVDQFKIDMDALTAACDHQENELKVIQNIMRDQINRSKVISEKEDIFFHALNALEIDTHNFNEETHLVTKMCESIGHESDALSHVKLTSILFHIEVSPDSCQYPTINNLRLAYRINKKANLGREEINAAWVQAAQLVAFTSCLNSKFTSSNIRIIPVVYPCAKLVVNSPNGNSVYNLGWDTLAYANHSHFLPPKSIILFQTLLSQLVSHIIVSSDDLNSEQLPPIEMTPSIIDGVDVTKLLETNSAAWSSVVFCIALNLQWLSKLPLHTPRMTI